MSSSLAPPPINATRSHRASWHTLRRGRGRGSTVAGANGEPMIWLTGACAGRGAGNDRWTLGMVLVRGLSTFWPQPLVKYTTVDGETLLGEVAQARNLPAQRPAAGRDACRRAARMHAEMETLTARHTSLVRTGNYDLAARTSAGSTKPRYR